MSLDIALKVADLIQKILGSVAILVTGWWFLFRKESAQRVGFDVECKFVSLDESRNKAVTEVAFRFINTGKVETLIYNLMFSVHGLDLDNPFEIKPNAALRFPRQLIPAYTRLVPVEYGFYVRPGVTQYITHNILLDQPGPVIRIIASFSRVPGEKPPDNEVQLLKRIFEIPRPISLQVGNKEQSSH